MLTDAEIADAAQVMLRDIETGGVDDVWVDGIIRRAMRKALALADEKGRPEPPTPTRKSWPRGLWAPIEAGELPDVFDDTEREALALALNEFPAAVAILREDQRMWPKAVPETHPARTHFTNRDDFLTRVDAAGFDL